MLFKIFNSLIHEARDNSRKLILDNYFAGKQKWIAPGPPHYLDAALWDSCFQFLVCYFLSTTEEMGEEKSKKLLIIAEKEIANFTATQKPSGMIPHSLFLKPFNWFEKYLYFFGERVYFFKPNFSSDYTQPPILPQVLEMTENQDLMRKYLPVTIKFYNYLIHEQMDKGLLFQVHPHETGTDNSLSNEYCLGMLGMLEKISRGKRFQKVQEIQYLIQRWGRIIRLDIEYKKRKWDIQEIKKSKLFLIKTILSNCLFSQGLRSLSRMIKSDYYLKLATQVESQIIKKMWDPTTNFFYDLDGKDEQIKLMAATGLIPLILAGLPKDMSEKLYLHLVNKNEFSTNHPIPSVPVNSPFFNPDRDFTCNWQGASWKVLNWLIVQGLLIQYLNYPEKKKYAISAYKIIKADIKDIVNQGFYENYNPYSGEGLRVKNFGSFSLLPAIYPETVRFIAKRFSHK